MTGQFDPMETKTFYEYDAGKSGRELAYGRLDIVLKELKKRLKNKAGKRRVLDIGVSDGYLIKRISEMGVISYGMDIAYKMLKLVAENISSEEKTIFLIQGSITHLPFANNSFDAITACEILEHLDEYNLLLALKELKRVLVPGGSLFITTPYNEQIVNSFVKCPACGNFFPPSAHYSNFNENKWLSIAANIGFLRLISKKYTEPISA